MNNKEILLLENNTKLDFIDITYNIINFQNTAYCFRSQSYSTDGY